MKRLIERYWSHFHRHTYFIALAIFAIALPFSKFILSVALFILFFNWLFDIVLKRVFFRVPIKNLFSRLRSNKAGWVLLSVFIILLLGALYSEDFNNTKKVIRIFLPLIVLPLIVSTEHQLSANKLKTLLMFFVFAVLLSSFVNAYAYFTDDYQDIRQISIFTSHIRFALMVNMAIFITGYYTFTKMAKTNISVIFSLLLIGWFVAYHFISESVTGVSTLLIALGLLFLFNIRKIQNNYCKIGGLILIIVVPLAIFFYLQNIYNNIFVKENVDFANLEIKTKYGNKYKHDTTKVATENGHYIWIYYCPKELKKEWNKRSEIKYFDRDKRNQLLRYTLIRFLASKGYRKDAEGIKKLTGKEVAAIENGIANYKYMKRFGLYKRLHKIFWEIEKYNRTNMAANHSVTMRLEYWKTGLNIVKENWLFGVGIGDVEKAYQKQYEKDQSNLPVENRRKSHNQFLYFTIALGIIGLIWFLFYLFYPGYFLNKFNDQLYLFFFIIAFMSFLTEDTLRTQIGVSFFAFFNTLILLTPKKME